MLTTIVLQVFEESGDALVQLLPLRSVTISMPTIDKDGNGYVRFEGTFALQPDDPYSLWRFLLRNEGKITGQVTVVDDNSDATVYGAYGNFTPTPDPDGSTTFFTIPFGYILGTTELYLRLTGEPGARRGRAREIPEWPDGGCGQSACGVSGRRRSRSWVRYFGRRSLTERVGLSISSLAKMRTSGFGDIRGISTSGV